MPEKVWCKNFASGCKLISQKYTLKKNKLLNCISDFRLETKATIRRMLTIAFISLIGHVSAQTSTIQLFFNPTFGEKVLELSDSSFHEKNSSNLQINVLKFYITDIQFFKDGKLTLAEPNSFHLIDAAQKLSLLVAIADTENIDFNTLKFNLGVDSIINVSGAMGGDLDPTNGMYWAWQSGYINFKLEGKSDECKTRNNEFEFHIGGYMPPYYCLQKLEFSVEKKATIKLAIDVGKIVNAIDLAKLNHVLSPSNQAVAFSKIVAQSFSIVAK